ncbi:MAG TPA: trigger factor [Syntrophomonadaceae bacterium]|nr:trigger factor [Syntrophomonadaceae bacterium]
MEYKLEKIENSEAYIEIEVDPGKMDEAMEKAYRKVVKQVSIPGFRKGRAPRHLLEAHYGKEILLNEALEWVVPEAYAEVLEKMDIDPIAQPEFEFRDLDELGENENFKFIARVAIRPEVTLGELEGLEVSIPKLEVSDKDVDWRLEEMRARYAELEEKEDGLAEMGDTVTIDFEGFVDGEAFAGGKGEDYLLELGSKSFIPGFEEQLVGLKKDEGKEIAVTFPESYRATELAGKDAVFKTLIKRIEGKKLRPLDDDFAQEVSQFDSLEELRSDIKNNMVKNLEDRHKEMVKRDILQAALERCQMEVPEAAIRAQTGRMIQELEQSMNAQGLNLQQYYQYTNSNEEETMRRMWPEAERMVRIDFMLEKLVDEKGFAVSDEEVDKKIEEIALEMQADPQEARKLLKDVEEKIVYGMKVDKAVDYLVEKAIITEKDLSHTEPEIEPAKSEEEA